MARKVAPKMKCLRISFREASEKEAQAAVSRFRAAKTHSQFKKRKTVAKCSNDQSDPNSSKEHIMANRRYNR